MSRLSTSFIMAASTPDHQMAPALATSVMCSCGWLMSNPDEDDLIQHAGLLDE